MIRVYKLCVCSIYSSLSISLHLCHYVCVCVCVVRMQYNKMEIFPANIYKCMDCYLFYDEVYIYIVVFHYHCYFGE